MLSASIYTVLCGSSQILLPGPEHLNVIDNFKNRMTPCQAYQEALERCDTDIIIMIHNDVSVHDARWLQQVMWLFETGAHVTAVGFGGALSLGSPSLYKRPYRIEDMARGCYRSNQRDWQVHGTHLIGMCQVAVLDAFFMAIRTESLRRWGGWPTRHLTHHCLDLWLACEAARSGGKIFAVGVDCTHHGGGASTNPIYREAKWLQGGSMEEDHRQPHRWLYDNYADVLPITL